MLIRGCEQDGSMLSSLDELLDTITSVTCGSVSLVEENIDNRDFYPLRYGFSIHIKKEGVACLGY